MISLSMVVSRFFIFYLNIKLTMNSLWYEYAATNSCQSPFFMFENKIDEIPSKREPFLPPIIL